MKVMVKGGILKVSMIGTAQMLVNRNSNLKYIQDDADLSKLAVKEVCTSATIVFVHYD
jgi:hypothetical protein